MTNPRAITLGKEIVKDVIEEAGKIVKTGKTKKAETLLEKKKIPVKIGDKKEVVAEGTESVIKVSKKDFKVKQPKVNVDQSDEALWLIKNTKITPKILSDFNINKINSKGDILKLIEITSKLYKGSIAKQTRETRGWEETKRLASLLQKNPEDLQKALLSLKPGDTLNAEYILAARELLAAGMSKLDELAKAAATGSADDVLKFRQHFALMGEFQKVIKGVQTETARALQQFRIPTRSKTYSSVQLDRLNEEALLVEFGGIDDIQGVARLYLSTGTKKAQVKFVNDIGDVTNFSKASDAIAEVYLNAILSNPMTHIRNTAGNWITQAINSGERKVAAHFFGGKDIKGIAQYEDIAKAFGMQQSSTEMFSALSVAFRKDGIGNFIKNFDKQIKSNFGGTSKVELRPNRFTSSNFEMKSGVASNTVDFFGQALTLGRVPTRFLSVMDNWFKNREYRSELYALAFRDGMEKYNRGILKKENIAAYIADRVVNPTKSMVKEAYDAAHYITYQTKLASQKGNNLAYWGNLIQKGKSNSGFMSWLSNYYLPFIQTPTNIASFVAERTPIAAKYLSRYKTEIAAGGARKQMAETRLRLGAMFYMMMAPLGYFSVLGGSHIDIPGKTTGGKFETLKALGVTNNNISIPVGDKLHSFNTNGLDPFNMMLSMAANSGKFIHLMTHNVNYNAFMPNEDGEFDYTKAKVSIQDITGHMLAMTLGFGEILSNSTFLMGVSNVAKDVSNANKAFSGDISTMEFTSRWWNKFSSSFIPGVVRETNKWISDDFRKLAVEHNEWIMRSIYDENLHPDYNLFGQKIPKFGYHMSTEVTPAMEAFKNVMPRITPIKKKIPFSLDGIQVSVPLNSKQLSFMKKRSGEIFNEQMTLLVNGEHNYSESFLMEGTEQLVKSAIIKSILAEARSEAKGELTSEFRINEKGEEVENEWLAQIIEQGKEQKQIKILTEQRGKTLIDDNLNYYNQE